MPRSVARFPVFPAVAALLLATVSAASGENRLAEFGADHPIRDYRADVIAEIESGNYDLFGPSCLNGNNEVTCGKKALGHALVIAVLGKQYHLIDRFGSHDDFMRAGSDALFISATLGDMEAIDALLKKGREVGAIIESSVTVRNLTDLARHPGTGAAEYGRLDVIDYLLGVGQLDINMQVTEYFDLFVLAVLNEREETALGLLDRGYVFDCDFRFPKGRTLQSVAEEFAMTTLLARMNAICR